MVPKPVVNWSWRPRDTLPSGMESSKSRELISALSSQSATDKTRPFARKLRNQLGNTVNRYFRIRQSTPADSIGTMNPSKAISSWVVLRFQLFGFAGS